MAPPMKKRTLEGDVPRSPSKKVKTAKPARWTVRDDDALRAAVESGREPHCWQTIASSGFPEGSAGRHNALECEARWHNVLKLGLRKGRWLAAEDDIVKAQVAAPLRPRQL